MTKQQENSPKEMVRFDPVKFEEWKSLLGEEEAVFFYRNVLPLDYFEKIEKENLEFWLLNVEDSHPLYGSVAKIFIARSSFCDLCKKYLESFLWSVRGKLGEERSLKTLGEYCLNAMLDLQEDSSDELRKKLVDFNRILISYEKKHTDAFMRTSNSTLSKVVDIFYKEMVKFLVEKGKGLNFRDFYQLCVDAKEDYKMRIKAFGKLPKKSHLTEVVAIIFNEKIKEFSFEDLSLLLLIEDKLPDHHDLFGEMKKKGTVSDWVSIYNDDQFSDFRQSTFEHLEILAIQNQ